MTPPPLPATCSVTDLADWITANFGAWPILAGRYSGHALKCAERLRALLVSKCESAVIAYDPMANGDPKLDDVISRVLGAAK